MNKGLRWTRSLVRSLGYDVVRFPRESHREHLQAVFSKLGINSVLDVGANLGAFVQLVRDAGFTGPVASFEPVEENVALLTAASAKDPHWTVHRLALGHENGTAALNVARDSRYSSFRPASEYARESFPGSAVESWQDVRVARLDSIFEEIAPPGDVRSFLKIDTQGWDLEVIEGATGCLDRICAIQSEVAVQPLYEDEPSYLDALPRLNELGFELSGVFPVSRDDALRIVALDCVLVRV
jgi:FkbM family methyltransferase